MIAGSAITGSNDSGLGGSDVHQITDDAIDITGDFETQLSDSEPATIEQSQPKKLVKFKFSPVKKRPLGFRHKMSPQNKARRVQKKYTKLTAAIRPAYVQISAPGSAVSSSSLVMIQNTKPAPVKPPVLTAVQPAMAGIKEPLSTKHVLSESQSLCSNTGTMPRRLETAPSNPQPAIPFNERASSLLPIISSCKKKYSPGITPTLSSPMPRLSSYAPSSVQPTIPSSNEGIKNPSSLPLSTIPILSSIASYATTKERQSLYSTGTTPTLSSAMPRRSDTAPSNVKPTIPSNESIKTTSSLSAKSTKFTPQPHLATGVTHGVAQRGSDSSSRGPESHPVTKLEPPQKIRFTLPTTVPSRHLSSGSAVITPTTSSTHPSAASFHASSFLVSSSSNVHPQSVTHREIQGGAPSRHKLPHPQSVSDGFAECLSTDGGIGDPDSINRITTEAHVPLGDTASKPFPQSVSGGSQQVPGPSGDVDSDSQSQEEIGGKYIFLCMPINKREVGGVS